MGRTEFCENLIKPPNIRWTPTVTTRLDSTRFDIGFLPRQPACPRRGYLGNLKMAAVTHPTNLGQLVLGICGRPSQKALRRRQRCAGNCQDRKRAHEAGTARHWLRISCATVHLIAPCLPSWAFTSFARVAYIFGILIKVGEPIKNPCRLAAIFLGLPFCNSAGSP